MGGWGAKEGRKGGRDRGTERTAEGRGLKRTCRSCQHERCWRKSGHVLLLASCFGGERGWGERMREREERKGEERKGEERRGDLTGWMEGVVWCEGM